MSIGTFTIIRNESPWIAAHILRVLPFVDEMVLFDGNSTDGTLETIKAIQKDNFLGWKIKLHENKDCADLKDDYVRVFNECLHSLSTDLAWFLHPDMYVINPEQILLVKGSPAVAMSTQMRSFGGEPDGQLYEMSGRGTAWKNIYRLRSPELGAHYFGHYGAQNEDVYFRDITGSQHRHHGEDFARYPYQVAASGIEVLHFSDVRPYERRLGRMVSCLLNQGYHPDDVQKLSETHPRVSLISGEGFDFTASKYPKKFTEARNKYRHLERELVKA